MTPTISLCVPTYRRAERLATMLPALVAAVTAHPRSAEFEICVSDNASPDATPEVIARAGNVVRSVRQATNLGFAGNVAALLRMATGDAVVFLADDDVLVPGALEALLEVRGGPAPPLAVVNSLPGGDVVFRGRSLPEGSIELASPRELVEQLGIFQASFLTNLVFDRKAALASWRDDFRRSRYPHMVLALEMMRSAPARYVPAKLVEVTLPADTGDQPLLTAIDMARVLADHAPGYPAWSASRYLVKMLPTAIYQHRTGRWRADAGNPYASLSLSNVLDCYRHSWRGWLAAGLLWTIARLLPTSALGGILKRLSRHAR